MGRLYDGPEFIKLLKRTKPSGTARLLRDEKQARCWPINPLWAKFYKQLNWATSNGFKCHQYKKTTYPRVSIQALTGKGFVE